jgi:ribose transport system ATP-binding protein
MSALKIRDLSKTFAGNQALRGFDLDLDPGEVHSLVGQNGSGKSTLIKVLAGYHRPDPGGMVEVAGRRLEFGDTEAAAAIGLRFVHQDLGLVPTLGAVDNLALGRGYITGRFGTISWRREARSGERLLRDLGYDFDLSAPISTLSASERTGIAIVRATSGWSGEAKVLVLDEPTASLPAAEVERLFQVIRALSARGVAIIYVSHHFNEVFEICDAVTVLRDGVVTARRPTAELDEQQLIELTIGRSMAAFERATAVEHQAGSESVMKVRGLCGKTLRHLDLDLRPGEIVGIAGVTGSGREEVTELIFGAVPREGQVEVGGKVVPQGRPDVSIDRGIVLVPANRAEKAALSDRPVHENLTVSRLSPFYRALGLDRKAERRSVAEWLDRLAVVPRDGEAAFATLSGGNQQKVIVARALRVEPTVLLLDEPTQGVDVGAKAAIHETVQAAAERHAGVIVASTESEELVSLCDRIVVLARGRLVGIFDTQALSADDLTEITLSDKAAERQESAIPAAQRRV